jgi:hypothetical protein
MDRVVVARECACRLHRFEATVNHCDRRTRPRALKVDQIPDRSNAETR